MGDYLKQQYEERELAKALAKVHGIIDEETQKLSDKVKELKLSHNRMRKLLKMSLKYIEGKEELFAFLSPSLKDAETEYLHKRITLELYGLENYKGLKGGRK